MVAVYATSGLYITHVHGGMTKLAAHMHRQGKKNPSFTHAFVSAIYSVQCSIENNIT